VPTVGISGSLNLLEPWRPLQACIGIASALNTINKPVLIIAKDYVL
jgi:hypothetical protein